MSFSIGPRLLVLARHGQSEGNQQNIFTGWRDLPLTAQGEDEARLAGARLRELGVVFDAAFTSRLSRASASCSLMLETMKQGRTKVESDAALNERDYGDLTGLNKDQARQQFGADQVHVWRRLRPKTIQDAKLAPIRAILQWGMHNEHISFNPADGISLDARSKQGEKKRSFTDDEAKLILRAALIEEDPVRRSEVAEHLG